MPILPTYVRIATILNHMIKIVNAVIMVEVSLSRLVLLDPLHSCHGPFPAHSLGHIEIHGWKIIHPTFVGPVDWKDTNFLVHALALIEPSSSSTAGTFLIATIGLSNRIALAFGQPDFTPSW